MMTKHSNSQTSDTGVVYGLKPNGQEDLRKAARDQKVIWICALVYLAINIGYWASPVKNVDAVLGLLMPFVGVPGGIFTIIFATKLRNIALMVFLIIMGLCAFCPVAGFLPLIIAGLIGAYILKKNGVKVGFLGAKL